MEKKKNIQELLKAKRATFRKNWNSSTEDWLFVEKEHFSEELEILVTVFSREWRDALWSCLYVFTPEGEKQQLYFERCYEGVVDGLFIKDIAEVTAEKVTVIMQSGYRKDFWF